MWDTEGLLRGARSPGMDDNWNRFVRASKSISSLLLRLVMPAGVLGLLEVELLITALLMWAVE